jgi:light-regulated signal transduction histidine kinase (bacteriophytochrome)
MESMGKLAGGIAHDFDNLLNIVHSYVTLMRTDLKNPASMEEHLNVIDETVNEGSALTQQLLTVARQNKVQFDLTSINKLINTVADWLESTLPKTITITAELDASIPHILADANQLNPVLLNLCLNARDAMEEAGSLKLSTTLVAGNELREHFPGIEDQNYVCITVADNGPGWMKKFGSISLSRFSQPSKHLKEPGSGFPSYMVLSSATEVSLMLIRSPVTAAPFTYPCRWLISQHKLISEYRKVSLTQEPGKCPLISKSIEPLPLRIL